MIGASAGELFQPTIKKCATLSSSSFKCKSTPISGEHENRIRIEAVCCEMYLISRRLVVVSGMTVGKTQQSVIFFSSNA